jgi:hypothetical protein
MAEMFVQAYKFHLIMHNFASADRLYIKGQNALQERGQGQ